MNVQVICDQNKRVIYFFAGMSGSCHDLTCLRRSSLWGRSGSAQLFDNGQYLLGDSGYIPLDCLVCLYKRTSGDMDKVDFNTCIAHARVGNEHCIGILKARWHSLKEIRMQLRNPVENAYVIRWIRCCFILHNFLIWRSDEWSEDDHPIELETEDDLGPPPQGARECNRRGLERRQANCCEFGSFLKFAIALLSRGWDVYVGGLRDRHQTTRPPTQIEFLSREAHERNFGNTSFADFRLLCITLILNGRSARAGSVGQDRVGSLDGAIEEPPRSSTGLIKDCRVCAVVVLYIRNFVAILAAQTGAPLHFELYTEEDDVNYIRWKWISKKEAHRVLRGTDATLLKRSGLHDALWMDWARPEEGTTSVREFILNWDDRAQSSTIGGREVPLTIDIVREYFLLPEGSLVLRTARHYDELSDWVPERSRTAKTWYANDVFLPVWRPIIQLVNVVLLGKQKPLELTGAFL
ncbi:hypothetical protein R1sor_016403 [Riccia sorocarpa]|uniref:DDE Tnp4 domain-containing protein n=1 Tax=Riccia sorocarpa TaxID=122646 RepID=A0ABD3HL45_9MARC